MYKVNILDSDVTALLF